MNSCLIIFIILSVVVLPRASPQSIRGFSSQYPYEIGGNVSSPVKVILVLLIFGMFLIAFFSLYLRRCLEDTSSETRTTLPIVNNQLSRFTFPCGLDKSVVESFPVFLYSDVKELNIGKGALECAVCISEFSDDERLRFLPKCHHVFHPDCIDAWLASHTTCPVCRSDLTSAKLSDSEIYQESSHLTRPTRPTRPTGPTQSQIDDSRCENVSQNHNLYRVKEERAGVATRRFPRSHSTGHSLVSPGENCERYTLRLPEEVRKQIVTLKRAKSCGSGVDENPRRSGRRWNPDRICGKSELWNCTVRKMPVFIAKTDSGCKNDSAQSSSSATLSV